MGLTRYIYVRPYGRGRRVWHYVAEDGNRALCGLLPGLAWHLSIKPIGRLCRNCRKKEIHGDIELSAGTFHQDTPKRAGERAPAARGG